MEAIEKFDFNTIQNFDNHILKSIPNFDILTNSILSMSEYFITKDCNIYDLGCSTGNLLRSIPYNNNKIGYDYSALLPEDEEGISFQNIDLNNPFEINNACAVFSIFTMQFLNRSKRLDYCKTVYEGLNKGGAFFLCEKVYQKDGIMQEMFSFSHYDFKCNHFSEQEIIKKERDLRYIMKPNSQDQNIDLLKDAGFETITTFWQLYNFSGIIAIK